MRFETSTRLCQITAITPIATMAAPSQILEENVALWNTVPTKVGSNPFGHRVHAAFFPIAPAVGVGVGAPTEALATSEIKLGNMVCAFNRNGLSRS